MKIKSFLVINFLIITILCFGVVAKAQTTSVQEQINVLILQIQELQEQLTQLQSQQDASSETSVPTWCYTFADNLKMEDEGTGVVALQTALAKEGLFSASATGTFWKQTESAVIKFQEKYASDILTPLGLTRGTGYVGTSTRAKLNLLYACWANNKVDIPPEVQ
jgi:hypothetical protein